MSDGKEQRQTIDCRRARYPSDLTDAQWQRIAPLIPSARPGDHRRNVDIREIVNAICYLTLSLPLCGWPHVQPKCNRRDGTVAKPSGGAQRSTDGVPRMGDPTGEVRFRFGRSPPQQKGGAHPDTPIPTINGSTSLTGENHHG
jgi:hypothetical protein